MAAPMQSNIQYLELPDAPVIPGLRFRLFNGESDFPAMLAVSNPSRAADQEDRVETLEDLAHDYGHPINSDPYRDVLIAEVDRQAVAFSHVWWWKEDSTGSRYYVSRGFVHPQWRRKGLGRALLRYNEARLREIAEGHPHDIHRCFEVFVKNNQPGMGIRALLESERYQPARSFFFMLRPNLEDIPDLPLPEGLEVRPALPEHYRKVWNAYQEAFQDHWGYMEPSEEDYQGYLSAKEFQPGLWQIAWDGDEVVGMVLNYINHDQNATMQRLRGYAEGIAVRRPWRRRGLARALLARSLKVHRTQGMTEAALGVDSESPSGANRLYESMGFRTVCVSTTFRKPMD